MRKRQEFGRKLVNGSRRVNHEQQDAEVAMARFRYNAKRPKPKKGGYKGVIDALRRILALH